MPTPPNPILLVGGAAEPIRDLGGQHVKKILPVGEPEKMVDRIQCEGRDVQIDETRLDAYLAPGVVFVWKEYS